MVSTRWKRSNKSVYNVGYHLIWCPKYRRKVLINPVDKELKKLLLIKAKEINVDIEKMEILPDHVHVFVKGDPTSAPHWIVQQFKGYTSRMLREKFSFLKTKLPTLWTRSYYCESVGHISEATIKRYIEEQKGK
jgi:putative transposase